MRAANVKYRIKGTGLYVQPTGMLSGPYETTGAGRRSIAMRVANYGPNAAILYAGPQLRDQSRDAVRKNGIASAIVDRLVSNMVGTGITPQPESAKARKLFRRWTDQASADGSLDFYGIQAQVARCMVVGGEAFVRLRQRRKTDGVVVPFQLQVLEGDYVPFDKNESLAGGGYIEQGIEFDKIGRRVAYWMFRRHPGDPTNRGYDDATPIRVPASEVLHVYDAIGARPGQIRGEPWLTRTLAKLKDLDAYDDAELVRKKVSALLVGFIARSVPDGMDQEELAKIWGGTADIEDGVGNATAEPGTILYGEPGEEISWSTPADVGGQYEVFLRAQYRHLAMTAGLLYEQLSGDYGNLNDRTWRAAFNDFRRRCEMWQHHILVFQLCRPVWQRFALLAQILGLLTETEAPDMVPWLPQPWPYINPKQDIETSILEMRAGLSSRSKKAAERGEDSADIDAEQAADNKRADQLKLKYDSDGRSAGKANAAPPEQGELDLDGGQGTKPPRKK